MVSGKDDGKTVYAQALRVEDGFPTCVLPEGNAVASAGKRRAPCLLGPGVARGLLFAGASHSKGAHTP
ncbi:MAG: hypothetical protein RL653_2056 [Pseudomonadota bacterium]